MFITVPFCNPFLYIISIYYTPLLLCIGIIPKAVRKEHIRDNIQLNFTIDEEDMKALSFLTQNKYTWDPSNVC